VSNPDHTLLNDLLLDLPYPVLETSASVRTVLDVSSLTEEELDSIEDLGADFQHIDKVQGTLTVVLSVPDFDDILELDPSLEK